MEDTVHFWQMLVERGIPAEWADRATESPDRTEDKEDGTRHFIKQTPESGGRCLRVVVNVAVAPSKRSRHGANLHSNTTPWKQAPYDPAPLRPRRPGRHPHPLEARLNALSRAPMMPFDAAGRMAAAIPFAFDGLPGTGGQHRTGDPRGQARLHLE